MRRTFALIVPLLQCVTLACATSPAPESSAVATAAADRGPIEPPRSALLTPEQIEYTERKVFVLPKAEQLREWRRYARGGRGEEVQMEALKQLAWARDPAGVALASRALAVGSEAIRELSALVLAEYGRAAAPARDALFDALGAGGARSRRQIARTLVMLGDARVLDEVVRLHRSDEAGDPYGRSDFDIGALARLSPVDRWLSLAADPSASLRKLVATVLSRAPEAKTTDALIRLVNDPNVHVASAAAPGLARLGAGRGREALVAALRRAFPDHVRQKAMLESLRDRAGTAGLLLAVQAVSPDDEELAWYQTEQVFDLIHDPDKEGQGLNDPSGGDALDAYIRSSPPLHHQWRAAVALAAIGDLRAVPTLVKCLRVEVFKRYGGERSWKEALTLDTEDQERMIAARMLGDLAVLHPNQHSLFAAEAEAALLFWLHDLGFAHPEGLRALALMASIKALPMLRKLANPSRPLPPKGAQPPIPVEFPEAQFALRYLGWLKDQAAWPLLEKSLNRRRVERANYDTTREGLMHSKVVLMGVALYELSVGAADGFSEWGDTRAFKLLLDFIDDAKNNEVARERACSALAFVARKDDLAEVLRRVRAYSSDDEKDEARRICLLETLAARPAPGMAPELLDLVRTGSIETRHAAARALAKGGFDEQVEATLLDMMSYDVMRNDAALALMLGGTAEVAARTVAAYASQPQAALDELSGLWYRSFGFWSTEELESGLLFRYMANAEAVSRVSIRRQPQGWAPWNLMQQLDKFVLDNGPHSATRVELRYRLWTLAKGTDAAKSRSALLALGLMKEQGVLFALGAEPGLAGQLGRDAYADFLNSRFAELARIKPDRVGAVGSSF